MPKYKRILLKLSGEALMAGRSHGIDPLRLNEYVEEVIEISKAGVQVWNDVVLNQVVVRRN